MATIALDVDRFGAPPRVRFAATIFIGSFLLFLVQPMIARLALPRLGGAPSVWNSAMLAYQSLLLVGYAYAHWIGRLRPRTQASTQLVLLLVAALTLPIGLTASMPPPNANPFLWVPWLLLLSIGPLFFVVSAQAPLLQRWFALTDGGNPYPLYAASNLGSFGGLIAYPLFVEPMLPVSEQRWMWSGAYAALILLVAWCALEIPKSATSKPMHVTSDPKPRWRTIFEWIVLSAVPSGLILSTTLHITTDIIAMPLLWVLPLGAYLLSFSVAFSGRRGPKEAIIRLSPLFLLFSCVTLFMDLSALALMFCAISIVTLFMVSVALHSRLYDTRPGTQHLSLFYLAMSVGGVLGGAFCALIAPLTFNWTYEHLLLLFAAAWLIRAPNPFRFLGEWNPGDALAKHLTLFALALLVALALVGKGLFGTGHSQVVERFCIVTILLIAITAIGRRTLFAASVAALLIAAGGEERLAYSLTPGKMTRSFFGIYSIREGSGHSRVLAHGSTVHGVQNLGSPDRERMETSYYAPPSGVGLAMQAVPKLFGPGARIAVVGLGAGTLACYASADQHWTFYEIDPAVVRIARDPARFTFLSRCKPEARIEVGDARLLIERDPLGAVDLLVVDAFSSDAIPMHLLTLEAFADYRRLLSRNGILLVHISNRYIDLDPVLAQAAGVGRWSAAVRRYRPTPAALTRNEGASDWVALSPSAAMLGRLVRGSGAKWETLATPSGSAVWTDNYASVLPLIHWGGKRS
jgi:SAM-dependent methyltransferase